MGQTILVETAIVDSAVVFTTDRSITGQDGASYASDKDAVDDQSFSGKLAGRLYDAMEGPGSIFIASNQVVINRSNDWEQETINRLSTVIADFFLSYPQK
tara:strand:- start:28 stop:327 length:300 start_codon:yes stop_codon:yes gene_type:complete